MQVTSAEFKQAIMHINNSLNIAMYGVGLRKQRVYILDNTVIMILADHKRIPALATLDLNDRATTRLIDSALLEKYKKSLKKGLETSLHLSIKCILKDYEPLNETAATVILLEKALSITSETIR
ncbi:hypothetical protein Ga0466249_001033 [Sporomusaceae bacterium BoRhaA]|uniref:Na-translocating system protein MpsC family protein n=1 Tax=Pelorhabdus rhamnosifermentans TaxID=2772457 RepID=UPI001C060348|nr:Na-translocating system protein MpsC family protein [Pelorhabdus rhamnosifermentans]MBU2699941.1 hypothetical protein [Pelorhabdus rhamnosifermentans]